MFNKNTLVIGIAGGSASGKSTFTKQLKQSLLQFLDAEFLAVMHMDEYFKPESERPISPSPLTGQNYMDDNHPQTMDLEQFCLDLKRMIEKQSYKVIIAEGLLTLHDINIRELCDVKLFVECRADERIVRRIKRNMRWGQTLDQITEVYLNLVRFRHDEYVEPSKWQADFIINGSKPFDMPIAILNQYVKDYICNPSIE